MSAGRKFKIRFGYVNQDEIRLKNHQYPSPRVHTPLLRSMHRDGQQNPVILWATKGELRICYGISRCFVAYELAVPVLAVIADYDNKYPEFSELKNLDEVAACFVEPDKIKRFLNISDTKLWMNVHPRIAIDKSGTQFDDVSASS